MNSKGLVLIALIIPSAVMVSAQQDLTILQFDQNYQLLPSGNLEATWEITILPGGNTQNMILHAFFSQKASIRNLVVSDAEGSLNSRIITQQGVPLMEITFRRRLTPGIEYHFTCDFEVWKAVDMGTTEGSFTMLTGYNFPIEQLDITAMLPEGAKIRNYFPADGKVFSGDVARVVWSFNSLPSGYNIQISVAFDILSETYADSLFSDGMTFYELQDFENAREKFEQAREMFYILNLQEKVTQCDEYLTRIDGMEEGLPLFTQAVDSYEQESFSQALDEFQQVRSIYQEHQVNTQEVDDYIAKCNDYLTAFDELEIAETMAAEGNSKDAKTHFMKARDLFSQLGDTERVNEINAKIDQLEPEESRQPAQPQEQGRSGRVLFLGIVIVAVLGVVGFLMKKRKKPVTPVARTDEEVREEMRKLKARFVYGEINKGQYEEQLAELEKQLQTPRKKE